MRTHQQPTRRQRPPDGNRSDRRFHPSLCAASALLLATVAAAPLGGRGPMQGDSRPARPPSIDRLEAWLGAVGQHVPGSTDGPLQEVARWERAEISGVALHFQSVLKLIRDPRAIIVFQETRNAPGGRRVEALYSGADFRRLQQLAHTVAERVSLSIDIGVQEDRREIIADALVLRAAWLHTDLAIHGGGEERRSNRRATAFSEAFFVRMDDGRHTETREMTGHLETARTILGYARRVPSTTRAVALWYRATAAYLQRELHIDRVHVDQAVQLFPRDADLLFLAGALHEMCALPRVQEVVDTLDLPYGVTLELGSPSSELRRAERMLRRATEIKPGLTEARIRLGNVLGLLGRHADSVKELELALPQAGDDTLLSYYARMFLGREAAALGDVNKARTSYDLAARLYPRAQSPLVALSQLARRAGTDAAARELIDRILRVSRVTDDDPWWRYSSEAGRFAETLVAEARETFTGGQQP